MNCVNSLATDKPPGVASFGLAELSPCHLSPENAIRFELPQPRREDRATIAQPFRPNRPHLSLFGLGYHKLEGEAGIDANIAHYRSPSRIALRSSVESERKTPPLRRRTRSTN